MTAPSSASPTFLKGLFGVWQRNFIVYRQNWKISFIAPILEPLFYLLAFGYGLSGLVGNIRADGIEVSYVTFIAPALIAINIMNNAFFENTYSSFVRMYYQKTFDAMMATPLTVHQIITGEIVWGATKSMFATVIMMTVISAFGLIHYPAGLILVPLAFIGGMAFGAVGMFFTGIVKHIDLFNLPFFLFITPMFLFSGTFFPLENLPRWAQWIAMILPLTHLVNLSRSLCYGEMDGKMLWQLGYILAFWMIFFPLALRMMRQRLIR